MIIKVYSLDLSPYPTIGFKLLWCERGDLNPYSKCYWILNPARLPVPPLSHIESIVIILQKVSRINRRYEFQFILFDKGLDKAFVCKTVVTVVSYNNVVEDLDHKKP